MAIHCYYGLRISISVIIFMGFQAYDVYQKANVQLVLIWRLAAVGRNFRTLQITPIRADHGHERKKKK